MLITSLRTICQSVAEIFLTGLVLLVVVSDRFSFLFIMYTYNVASWQPRSYDVNIFVDYT